MTKPVFARCSSCPRFVRLNGDGSVRKHARYNAWQRGNGRIGTSCEGSNQKPKKEGR